MPATAGPYVGLLPYSLVCLYGGSYQELRRFFLLRPHP